MSSDAPIPITEFASDRARRYRKQREVLAFRSDCAITFDKSWGVQHIRAGGFVLIPLSADGKPAGEIYGIDGDEHARTYAPVEGKPHTYRKTSTVEAYQPGHPFWVDTVIDEHRETEKSRGSATAWLLRNPGGELYPVEDSVFRESYVPVTSID